MISTFHVYDIIIYIYIYKFKKDLQFCSITVIFQNIENHWDDPSFMNTPLYLSRSLKAWRNKIISC